MDSHWFKQWKKYVGFDSWDKYQMGDQNVYPGPVDNSGLLKGKSSNSPSLYISILSLLKVYDKCMGKQFLVG